MDECADGHLFLDPANTSVRSAGQQPPLDAVTSATDVSRSWRNYALYRVPVRKRFPSVCVRTAEMFEKELGNRAAYL